MNPPLLPALALLAVAIGTPVAAALAQGSSDVADVPSGGVRLDGTPIEIVAGLDIPWSVVLVGEEVFVSQRDRGDIVAFRLPHRADALHRRTPRRRRSRARGSPRRARAQRRAHRVRPGRNALRDDRRGAAARARAGPALAQDPRSLAGKILRMTPDAAVPEDNPSEGSLVYSMGHRHPQGLAWDDTGRLWSTEFGDDAWDELNHIEPGANYGWPLAEGRSGVPGLVDPIAQWRPKEMGPSGLAYIDGTFVIAGLTGRRVWTVTVDAADEVVATAYHEDEFGRIRDVLIDQDEKLWFVTGDTDGRGAPLEAGDDRILAVSLRDVGSREIGSGGWRVWGPGVARASPGNVRHARRHGTNRAHTVRAKQSRNIPNALVPIPLATNGPPADIATGHPLPIVRGEGRALSPTFINREDLHREDHSPRHSHRPSARLGRARERGALHRQPRPGRPLGDGQRRQRQRPHRRRRRRDALGHGPRPDGSPRRGTGGCGPS